MRKFQIYVVIVLLLSGCSEYSDPMIWPDFCKAQNRKIPAEERYRAALLNILSMRSKYTEDFAELAKYDPRYKDPSVHFFTYYDRMKSKGKMRTDAEIADRYVKEYPECCSLHPPTYLREKWDLDAYIDGGSWVADVRIWRSLPPHPIPHPTHQIKRFGPDYFGRQVNDCTVSLIGKGSANGL